LIFAVLVYSYFIASAGRIFAALHAGYKLPKAPSRTDAPNNISISSGFKVAIDNPPILDVPETTATPAPAPPPRPTLGSKRDEIVGAAMLPIAMPTIPAIMLNKIPQA
jgi:hypothetical protein